MEFVKTLVTPELALQLLEANKNNRRIKTPRLLQYTQEILKGNWKPDTGETIKISKTGRILDGQHRLMAVVKAKIPVHFHIVYGVEDNVFDVLDTGSMRNATDVFYIKGIKNQNTIPSIIATYNLLTKGFSSSGQVNHRATNAELLDQYFSFEMFWQVTTTRTIAWYQAFAKILPPSAIGGLYSLFYDISPDQAEEFFNQLCTGQNISNNMIAMLRQKLMRDKMSPKKMPLAIRYGLIIKTWNFYRKGIQKNLLKFDLQLEGFPKPI